VLLRHVFYKNVKKKKDFIIYIFICIFMTLYIDQDNIPWTWNFCRHSHRRAFCRPRIPMLKYNWRHHHSNDDYHVDVAHKRRNNNRFGDNKRMMDYDVVSNVNHVSFSAHVIYSKEKILNLWLITQLNTLKPVCRNCVINNLNPVICNRKKI